nr:hypothetical protein [Marinobacterium litorale]
MLALVLLLGQAIAFYQSATQAASGAALVTLQSMDMTGNMGEGDAHLSSCEGAAKSQVHCRIPSSQFSHSTEQPCCEIEQAAHCAGGHCAPGTALFVTTLFEPPVLGEVSVIDIRSVPSEGHKTLPWQPPKVSRTSAA